MIIRHLQGGDAREVRIRGGLDGLRAWAGMSSHCLLPEADNYPTDFDPRFDRPQPRQSENWGADQDV